MTIRVARDDDAPMLAALVLAFRDHLGASEPAADTLAERLPAMLGHPDVEFCLALSDAGEGVGYTQCRFHPSVWRPGPEAHLEDLFVTERARGSGLGRALLQHALERAVARGAVLLGLHTNEGNEPAQALYRAAGFRPRTEARWDGGREIYWTRRLEPAP